MQTDQSIKEDRDKPALSLCPQRIIREIVAVREFGRKKYPEDSWKQVDRRRHFDACLRHLSAMVTYGLDSRAEDSGLLHAAHAACDLAFIIELGEEPTYESSNHHADAAVEQIRSPE